jgi:acyl-CoA carboxylase subunit beta
VTAVTAAQASEAARWQRCGRCRELVYGIRFERLHRVCPLCGCHDRLTAPQRLACLLDPRSAEPVESAPAPPDPLRFADTVPYPRRLAQAQAQTGLDEAVIAVRGTIGGRPVAVAAMDFRFLGGSLGCEAGERITAAVEAALAEERGLLLVSSSGGARMQEGALALMQMAKTSQALAALDEAGILTVSLITDPTYGGVAASFATLADVIIAEPGARLGFAGPRVIQQTIGQRLPDGFQTAEFLLAHGLIDDVQPRAAQRGLLAELFGCAERQRNHLSWRMASGGTAPTALVRDPAALPEREPWEVAKAARSVERPTTLDYAAYMLDSFIELHGDRVTGDCPAIVGGLGRIQGRPVMLIGHQKGHHTAELASRRFGMALPAGYRKAARLMRLAAKLGVPILTLIDTPGAYPGVEAEEQGQAIVIAENLRLMSGLGVPIVAVVTGEGGSGGALALGVADQVLALSNTVYSVISPEGCAAILWRDAAEAPAAAAALRMTARDLLARGVLDAVIPEPDGGAGAQPVKAAAALRDAVTATLAGLAQHEPPELIRRRRARFRGFGTTPA